MPHILEFNGIVIPTYGVVRVLAFAVALWVGVTLTAREGIGKDVLVHFSLLTLLVAVGSSKFLLLFRGHHLSYMLRAGGGFYDGLIPGIMFAAWYVKHQGLPVLKVLDGFSPAVALGLAIARVGCFAAGCCYGKPTDSILGVTYTNSALTTGVPLQVPLHPTQLYESVLCLVVFGILVAVRNQRHSDGQVFGLMLVACGTTRLGVELFRGDAIRGMVVEGWLSVPQLISLLLILTGSGLVVYLASASGREPKLKART